MSEKSTRSPKGAADGLLGEDRQIRKALSSLRLKVAFMLFVSALLMSLCGLIFSLVSQIFGALTPAIQADLEWKAERGVAELAQSAQYGLVRADERELRSAFRGYDLDADFLAIVATDKTGKLLAQSGKLPGDLEIRVRATGATRPATRRLFRVLGRVDDRRQLGRTRRRVRFDSTH